MAFAIPEHLPRRAVPPDVSSSILDRIDAATHQTLKAELARSWLAELDESIRLTRQRIRDRIQSDLPRFVGLLDSTKSARERHHALEADVDGLHEVVLNSETGLIPSVTRRCRKHAALVQEATEARVNYEALLHLSSCQRQYMNLDALIQAGKLTEAVEASRQLNALLSNSPAAVTNTQIMEDFKRKVRVAESYVEEQLSDAYSRSVIISHHEILMYPFVQVRGLDTVLSLSSVLLALRTDSLNRHLATFRRDLAASFIDPILGNPCSVVVETDISGRGKLTNVPLPPNNDDLDLRLRNISTVLDFLSAHFFPHLPASHWVTFSHSFCKLLSDSVLDNVLRPFLPSTFEQLSSYLSIAQGAVAFEEKYVLGMLGGDPNDRAIQSWVDGLCGHYERKRRVQILELARTVIISFPGEDHFLEEMELTSEAVRPSVVPEGDALNTEDDAWGFEDDEKSGNSGSTATDEDSWGFDDDLMEPGGQLDNHRISEAQPLEGAEPDPGDAWGWNDDNEATVDDSGEDGAWDDPWSEPSASGNAEKKSVDSADPIQTVSQPKVASRLEKLAAKNRKHANFDVKASSSSKRPEAPPKPIIKRKNETLMRPASLKTTTVVKEYYKVSKRMRHLVNIVESVITEGKHLLTSNLLTHSKPGSPIGSVILQTAPAILDLFRGLYPIKYAKKLAQADKAMIFSNDCLYLGGQIERIVSGPVQDYVALKDRFEECISYLKTLGESWYDDAVEYQRRRIDSILDGAHRFTDSADQDRYDECENAVNQALQEIRHLANQWKELLPKSKYYGALGSVTEAALSRILADILALSDIPEVESHQLGELCRIFNALEGLFVEDLSQPSFVLAYVPSWLKFSYMSELLEASMADITYLFETGALVDFSVDELTQLVRALFADTTLRTNTINKILAGHPIPAE